MGFAVGATLEVPGYPEVFAVGDNPVIETLPQASAAIAPVALAQGRHAADNIIRSLEGRALQPFSFRPGGYLVSLGMNDAVMRVGGLKPGGYGAWLLLWNAVHLLRLVGFKKQIQGSRKSSLPLYTTGDGAGKPRLSKKLTAIHAARRHHRA